MMRWFEGLGIFSIILVVIIAIISIIFSIITATTIATALHVVGLKWWIVAITIFAAIGSPLISITKRD